MDGRQADQEQIVTPGGGGLDSPPSAVLAPDVGEIERGADGSG